MAPENETTVFGLQEWLSSAAVGASVRPREV